MVYQPVTLKLWLFTTSNSFVVSSIALLQIGHAGTTLLLKLSRTQQLHWSEVHTQIFVSAVTISSGGFLPNAISLTLHFHF
jgi:hypothetical protein